MKAKHTFRGVVIHEDQPRFKGVIPRPAAPAKAGPAKIRVGREVSGRGGKGVTLITGVPLTGTALDELATHLKKICGAGGAVRDGNIEIQGEHRDRLVVELGKLGYEAKRSGG